MAKILVVDDEENLRTSLSYVLTREGFEVSTASAGITALEIIKTTQPHLVILDIMLPDISGFELCRRLRREHATPVLVLTAKTDEIDKVVGLELGADDYVTKPFSMRELVARVRALLRRQELTQTTASSSVVQVGMLKIELDTHRAFANDNLLQLKPKEFNLLAFLVQHPSRVFTRHELLEQVWGHSKYVDTRTIDVHVQWLRKRVREKIGEFNPIETVRGVGYRLREPD